MDPERGKKTKTQKRQEEEAEKKEEEKRGGAAEERFNPRYTQKQEKRGFPPVFEKEKFFLPG